MTPPANTKARAQKLPIGVLSRETGVNIETIRYYERIGLMPEPPRSDGGHRVYDKTHRQRLAFIRRARELGFRLDDIRSLLGLERSQKLACDEVKALTDRHIAEIREKIRDLKELKRVLSKLTAQCHGGRVPACPILDVLGQQTLDKSPWTNDLPVPTSELRSNVWSTDGGTPPCPEPPRFS